MLWHHHGVRLACIGLILWACSPGLARQSGIPLTGVVYDALSALPITGATVTSLATGRSAVTGADGRYLIEAFEQDTSDTFVTVAPGYDELRLGCGVDPYSSSTTQDWPLFALGAEEAPHFWRGFPHDYPVTTTTGLAVGPQGNVYVVMDLLYGDLFPVVREYTSTGGMVREWGGWGYGPGEFRGPGDVAVASDGTAFVVDQLNERVQRFTAEGSYLGEIQVAAGRLPMQVAVDGNTVYVAEYIIEGSDCEICLYSLEGAYLGGWPTPTTAALEDPDWPVQVTPQDIAIAPDSTLYILNSSGTIHKVWHLSTDGEVLDHWGDENEIHSLDFAVGPDGNLYFPRGDPEGQVGFIRVPGVKVYTPSGQLVRAWGEFGRGVGEFVCPDAIAFDGQGLAYVGDGLNGGIQCFTPEGSFVCRWGGGGEGQGEFGTALYGWLQGEHFDVAAAPDSSVYVCDTGNRRIQHLSATGEFIEAWGSQGTGPGQFKDPGPHAVAVAPNGTVYACEETGRVQRFSSSGHYLGEFQCADDPSMGIGPGHDLAVAPDGTLFVVRGGDLITGYSETGVVTKSWQAGGPGPYAYPLAYRIAVAPAGDVYVVRLEETGNGEAIDHFDGSGNWLGEIRLHQVFPPISQLLDIAVAPDDTLFATLLYRDGVRVVHMTGAGEVLETVNLDHMGAAARVDGWPTLTVSPTGLIWIGDDVNHRVVTLCYGRFPDVGPWSWAYEATEAAAAAGIVGGYADGLYHPNFSITRDQMAVYISRALAGGDAEVPTGPATATFPDVPTDHWAFEYVEYAYANSIVGGYGDGYHPSDLVDRGQMAVFIARCMVTPHGDEGLAGYTPPATPTFPDVPADYWSYLWIEYLYEQGIVGGYSDGYHPAETVNRAQMAVYVQRAFGLAIQRRQG